MAQNVCMWHSLYSKAHWARQTNVNSSTTNHTCSLYCSKPVFRIRFCSVSCLTLVSFAKQQIQFSRQKTLPSTLSSSPTLILCVQFLAVKPEGSIQCKLQVNLGQRLVSESLDHTPSAHFTSLLIPQARKIFPILLTHFPLPQLERECNRACTWLFTWVP